MDLQSSHWNGDLFDLNSLVLETCICKHAINLYFVKFVKFYLKCNFQDKWLMSVEIKRWFGLLKWAISEFYQVIHKVLQTCSSNWLSPASSFPKSNLSFRNFTFFFIMHLKSMFVLKFSQQKSLSVLYSEKWGISSAICWNS